MVGNDDAIRAHVCRSARVVGVENALDDERALPLRAHPLQVFPGDAGIEVVAHPRKEVFEPGVVAQYRQYIPERMRTPPKAYVPGPMWTHAGLPEAAQRSTQAGRAGKAGAI